MSITAPSLTQAREALVTFSHQKLTLLAQLREQGKKIADLEREVQKQSTAAAQAQQSLANARIEIEALRNQIPDDATHRAFEDLVQFLTAPAEAHPELRIAA